MLNDELEDEIAKKSRNLQQEISQAHNLEDDLDDLKNQSRDLKEKLNREESENYNLRTRLEDKDKELERMRGQLSVMERMLGNLNKHSNNSRSPRSKRYQREEIRERPEYTATRRDPYQHRNEIQSYPYESTTESRVKERLRDPRYMQDHFEGDRLKPSRRKELNPKSYVLRNQEDHFEDEAHLADHPRHQGTRRMFRPHLQPQQESNRRQEELNQVSPMAAGRFQNRDREVLKGRRKRFEAPPVDKSGHARGNQSSSNFLTWDNPYNSNFHWFFSSNFCSR